MKRQERTGARLSGFAARFYDSCELRPAAAYPDVVDSCAFEQLHAALMQPSFLWDRDDGVSLWDERWRVCGHVSFTCEPFVRACGWIGQDRAAQDRTGRDRAAQDRTALDRTGRSMLLVLSSY